MKGRGMKTEPGGAAALSTEPQTYHIRLGKDGLRLADVIFSLPSGSEL